jgi:hypothetical protein
MIWDDRAEVYANLGWVREGGGVHKDRRNCQNRVIENRNLTMIDTYRHLMTSIVMNDRDDIDRNESQNPEGPNTSTGGSPVLG